MFEVREGGFGVIFPTVAMGALIGWVGQVSSEVHRSTSGLLRW